MGAIGWWMLVIAAATTPPGDELVVRPGEPVAASVGGHPARLLVGSGRLDRLTLDSAWVAARGIKPAPIVGRAELAVGGRTELQGHHRRLPLSIAGRSASTRAFWFADVPAIAADGTIGPWEVPQARVTFLLAPPVADETEIGATLADGRTSSYAVMRVGEGAVGLSFDVESDDRFPVASAAAGALLARTFGGSVSGASWDVEILMGVRRPVRLLTLARPLVIGPLRSDRIAVRVRDRIDASGRGAAIAEAGATDEDPAEVEVLGRMGRQPSYSLTLPRASLAGCSSLRFDKPARRITLRCK